MKDNSKRWSISLIIILAALFALIIGAWIQHQTHKRTKPIALNNGTILPTPLAIKSFSLTDDNGKPFTQANLKGHWSLLFFGFTHCPIICPTTLAELNKAYQRLQSSDAKTVPQVVFISIDPERDTAQKIHTYLNNFNNNFVGATGDKTQLNQLTKQLGIAYMKATKSGAKNYDVEHSGAILVLNPKGEWVALLSAPHSGKEIAQSFLRIQQQ